MAMTCFVSSDFVHPHVDNQHVRQSQTKKSDLLLEYFLMCLPFRRVKALGIDYIEVTDIMEPKSFSAPLPSYRSVQYRKFGAEDMIEECAFSGALSPKDGNVGVSRGKPLQVWTESKEKYFILRSSRIIFIISNLIIFN